MAIDSAKIKKSLHLAGQADTSGLTEAGDLGVTSSDGQLQYNDGSGPRQVLLDGDVVAGVSSVNGQTGDVILELDDIDNVSAAAPDDGDALIYDSATQTWQPGPSADPNAAVGPASSSDNAIVRFDGLTGKLLKNSGVLIDNANNVSGVADLAVTGTTILNTSLSGYVKAASGVVSAGPIAASDLPTNIDAAKIADGSVSNTEFQYLNNVSSGIQGQLDGKQPLSTLTTKGDLYAATASATVTRQGVGSNGQILVADSAQSTGMKWANKDDVPINFMRLDSSWLDVNADNSTADVSVGSWAAFADSASSLPTDLTGGSPNTTVTRTTTSGEVLNGQASFKITKSANNRQGEGASCTFNVPPAYQGKVCSINIPFKMTGTVVSGDIGVWIYDVTNSVLITPFNNSLLGASGTLVCTFPTSPSAGTPANQQYRIGFYFASTSANAVTIIFDDVYVGPQTVAYGSVSRPWQPLDTTGIAGFTTSSSSLEWSQEGGNLLIRGGYTWSAAAASEARFPLPSGFITAPASGSGPSNRVIGIYITGQSSTNEHGGPAIAEPGLSYFVLGRPDTFGSNAVSPLTKINGSTILGTGSGAITFGVLSIPVLSSGSQPLTSASTFRISSYLANGTRLTGSAPTQLGQYRSYLRSSGTTYTETNGSPTALPSSANGIRIYNGNAFNNSDTNNEPTKFEIFAGINKNIAFQWYASAGRTGVIDVSPNATTADYGYFTNYDPTTGIVTIVANRSLGGTSSHISGMAGDGNSGANDPYFDIIVSEPAIPVQVGNVRAYVRYETLTGNGSTNTKIGYFGTAVENTGEGSAWTTAQSATLGGSVTILQDGVYKYVATTRRAGGGGTSVGVSLNSAQLTTDIDTITAANRLCLAITGSSTASVTAEGGGFLPAGSVLRWHGTGNSDTGTVYTSFTVTKVSN